MCMWPKTWLFVARVKLSLVSISLIEHSDGVKNEVVVFPDFFSDQNKNMVVFTLC